MQGSSEEEVFAQAIADLHRQLQSSLGIEACSGAHFIGAALRSQGHDVRLIPASS